MWQKLLSYWGTGKQECWRMTIGSGILMLGALAVVVVLPCPSVAAADEVPVISASVGPCSADFLVTDSSNKPIYNAKVRVKVAYGFMSKRKTDLEIGTNGDGKARVEGLPAKLKKPPLDYSISYGGRTEAVIQDPSVDCHASFNVHFK